ncbi:hypothetical protein PR202_ga15987 [Eleusine coracana subsp. coracana]|uniref:Uncharacterized protein n=1 Tax=Eleusine coracana subsp. coracana TaxID=191504 RepID=A0AAV5CLL2_ELECO|nr:hypothetical protein PR202_ga15987 [Eleusine coracana subsp. coracana]
MERHDFIDELHSWNIFSEAAFFGGDFNLVRYQKDKSNGLVDFKWCEKFNEWIDSKSLLELELMGRKFTWSNNQKNPIFSNIDQIFCSTELDCIFPLVSAKALPREPSDHVPIVWDSGCNCNIPKPRFKFEKWWLGHSDFGKIVEKVSGEKVEGNNAVDIWNGKVRKFRRVVKGWSNNVEAKTRRTKERLSREYDNLDILAES